MSRTPRAFVVSAASSLALALGLAACGGADEPAATDGGVRVVATIDILADVARQVVGPDGTVTTLVPGGADPHSYRLSAVQARRLREADLVVAVGLGLEASFADPLEAAERAGTPIVRLGPALDPLPFALADEHGHGERADEPGGQQELDPHVWWDPVRMATGVRLIGDRLTEIVGAGPWAERADAYAATLLGVDERIAALVGQVPPADRQLVTNHDALGYFAARYGFEVLGAVIPGGSTLATVSAKDVIELLDLLEEHDVRAIFAESTAPRRLADKLATQLDRPIEVVVLDTGSLGPQGSDTATYEGFLLTGARRIVAALAPTAAEDD